MVKGTEFPIDGSRVRKNCVAPRLTRPYIHPRSIKGLPVTPQDLLVKSN